jgi:hypothetical protein
MMGVSDDGFILLIGEVMVCRPNILGDLKLISSLVRLRQSLSLSVTRGDTHFRSRYLNILSRTYYCVPHLRRTGTYTANQIIRR